MTEPPSSADSAALLLTAMLAMAPAGVRVGCRVIAYRDEEHLLPEEKCLISSSDPASRRASGAARHVARGLLAELGHPGTPVRRGKFGAPIWPEGVVGSLAHDHEMAVAAVGSSPALRSVGIDIEPAEPLPDDIYSLVVTPADAMGAERVPFAGRVLFAAKEATYKAVYPLDGLILHYDDIAVDLAANCALTRAGHSAKLFYCIATHVAVLAVVFRTSGDLSAVTQ